MDGRNIWHLLIAAIAIVMLYGLYTETKIKQELILKHTGQEVTLWYALNYPKGW